MNNIAETFITEFHNLEGITVTDKRRNFFNLLQKYSTLEDNHAALDAITSQLTIRTHLEKIFYTDFLIRFCCFKELFSQFLKRDEIVINKITKHKWFFQKIFRENSTEFVNTFIPTLSVSLRLKILKKLTLILNEKESDGIFDALVNRYGVFIASNILTSCSCLKIEDVLRTYPIKLWTSQLKLLYNKMPNLIIIYIEELVKHEGNSNFLNRNHIIHFIAMKNPEMFCTLQEKYKFIYCRIGKRSTKKILQSNKHRVVAKPELYVQNIRLANLVRRLGKDFDQVYQKLFPKNLDQVFHNYSDAARLLHHFPKRLQFNLFRNTYDKVFDKSLEQSCPDINSDNYLRVIKLISCNEEREKWVQLKGVHDGNDQFLKYYKADTCINTVQPKLNIFVPTTKKIDYIATITETCLINKDWKALLTVCQLLCDMLKNDDQMVHSKFLETLMSKNYKYVFDNLSEEHWKYIKQIIVKAENFNSTPLIFKFIEFGDVDENEIINLLKKMKWVNCVVDLKSKPEMEKRILLLLIKIAPQIVDTVEEADIYLIWLCKNYSLRHPNEKINIFDHVRLIQSVKYVLVNGLQVVENHVFAKVVEWIICVTNRNEEIENLTELYWEKFNNVATTKATFWFLHHRPDLVIKNIDKFMDVVIFNKFCSEYYWYRSKETKSIWKIVKCYSHLQLDQKAVDFCLEKLNGDYNEKSVLAEPLSLLMSAEEFTKIIQKLKPTVTKIDLRISEEKEKFQVQRLFLKSCVNVGEPEKVLPTIFEFLSGDYVASCISPLKSCLCKVPENRIKLFLDKLCNTGAVSVKKHGYYFVCLTQDEQTIFNSLKMCHLSQSIAMTFQHFVKNPTDRFWELLKHKLTKLDNNDHFTCLLLVNKPVPKDYKSQFFEVAYDNFRNKQNRFTNVLVDKLQEETIGQLNHQFFTRIENNFLTTKRSDFVLTCYLIHCRENTKFQILFNILQGFREQQWSLRSYEGREEINQLIMTLATVYLKQEITDASLVKTFAEGFHKIFPPVEVFEEFIMLSLIQFKNEDRVSLIQSVVHLHNDLINCYGKLIFAVFANCLSNFLKKLYPEESSQFEFYCSLLDFKKSVEDTLLIINLIPKQHPQLKESAQLYDKILCLLRQIKDKTVEVHLNLYIEQKESPDTA